MIKLVYLMGHGFSGSTLLTLVLNAHPEVATCGEMGIARKSPDSLETYACSCGELMRECPFWRTVTREMRARGFDFDPRQTDLLDRQDDSLASRVIGAQMRGRLLESLRRLAGRTLPAVRHEQERLLRRNEAFIDLLTTLKNCSTFLDSSKQPERALLLQRSERFRVYVLHLIRDGRAVTLSNMRNTGEGLEESAAKWVRYERYAVRARRYFPGPLWLTVRYEDLCGAPAATLGQILQFIGLAARPLENFRAAEHHVIGNRMRLEKGSAITLDERWRRELSADDRRRIDRILGTANRRYGYES